MRPAFEDRRRAVRTARAAGVFKEFHVLTDRPLEGCECYDAMECDKSHGLFKLHYLKVGMTRLLFEWFIWLDADTVFARNPIDVFGPVGKSPLHVPLEANLSTLEVNARWNGVSVLALRELFRREGIMNRVYLSGSAFWIIHHEAIDAVYDLALRFWHKAKEGGLLVDVSAALGYAMQILCADPEKHLLGNAPELWVSDYDGYLSGCAQNGVWSWRHPVASGTTVQVHPSIVHLARRFRQAQSFGNPDRVPTTSAKKNVLQDQCRILP